MTRFEKITESLKPFSESLTSFAKILGNSDSCPPDISEEECAEYITCIECCREYLLEEVD